LLKEVIVVRIPKLLPLPNYEILAPKQENLDKAASLAEKWDYDIFPVKFTESWTNQECVEAAKKVMEEKGLNPNGFSYFHKWGDRKRDVISYILYPSGKNLHEDRRKRWCIVEKSALIYKYPLCLDSLMFSDNVALYDQMRSI
jgi:hypothetical protein